MRHGNGFADDNPHTIRLHEDHAIFSQAYDFMCSGKLSAEVVYSDCSTGHLLLDFSDRFQLQELMDTYMDILLQRYPIHANTAEYYLALSERFNILDLRTRTLKVLTSYDFPLMNFSALPSRRVAMILSHVDFFLPRGDEQEILTLVKRWVRASHGRKAQVSTIFAIDRLSCYINL